MGRGAPASISSLEYDPVLSLEYDPEILMCPWCSFSSSTSGIFPALSRSHGLLMLCKSSARMLPEILKMQRWLWQSPGCCLGCRDWEQLCWERVLCSSFVSGMDVTPPKRRFELSRSQGIWDFFLGQASLEVGHSKVALSCRRSQLLFFHSIWIFPRGAAPVTAPWGWVGFSKNLFQVFLHLPIV